MTKMLFDIHDDERPSAIIAEATDRYRFSHLFGLFSGGHDSLSACHVAAQHPAFSGCVHINTGIGIDETREFVRQTCRDMGWPLIEYHPPDSYESIVISHGFPGPASHTMMYRRLKERCLDQLLREHGTRSRKILLVSGARRQESKRRMGNCNAITEGPKPSRRAVWVNPIIGWSGCDKRRYIRENDLAENPVVNRLCMSGECLCGAFAEPGELEVIRQWYPTAADNIDRIACKVKAAGKHCVWGTRPPEEKTTPFDPAQLELPLCFSCSSKYDRSMAS